MQQPHIVAWKERRKKKRHQLSAHTLVFLFSLSLFAPFSFFLFLFLLFSYQLTGFHPSIQRRGFTIVHHQHGFGQCFLARCQLVFCCFQFFLCDTQGRHRLLQFFRFVHQCHCGLFHRRGTGHFVGGTAANRESNRGISVYYTVPSTAYGRRKTSYLKIFLQK
jgi:hypothetical protein